MSPLPCSSLDRSSPVVSNSRSLPSVQVLDERSNTGSLTSGGSEGWGGIQSLVYGLGRRFGTFSSESSVPSRSDWNELFMRDGEGGEGSGSGWGEEGWKPEVAYGGIST